MSLDPELKRFATQRQAEYLDAILRYGSGRKAAKALNVTHSAVEAGVAAVKRKAALAGYAPECDMTRRVPDPFVLKGTSTLYGKDGEQKLQWVKTKLDDDMWSAAIQEWVQWLVKDAEGIAKPIKAPQHTNADLLTAYPMGDPHFGMYSWAKQTGASYDLDIAEKLHYAAIDRLVDTAPASDEALILELGDFFHADNNTNMTPRSGHILDTDTRWERVMQIGLRAMVYIIQRTLTKHKKVTVRIVKGNHDPHASFALALGLDAYFRNEPRVTIDLSAREYWYYRFGKCLFGVTHGDKIKQVQLPLIMAHDVPEFWGETLFRYFYSGHVHSDELTEHPGCLVERFRTLASPDSYAHGAGYRSGRDMKAIVHHREFGEVERHLCNIAMIQHAVQQESK